MERQVDPHPSAPVRVRTITGQIPVTKLGRTLMHEHIMIDSRRLPLSPRTRWTSRYRHAKVSAEIAWVLRADPFCNLDNRVLDDAEAAIHELSLFTAQGGRTVVDPTCEGLGRDPAGLAYVSERTGLQIVMGAGWYTERTHPDWVRAASIDRLVEHLLSEFWNGVDATGARPGIIGEIGVSPAFTSAEERCLRAACRAQPMIGVPLMVHLPGWCHYGHRILDIGGEEGTSPEAVVLCHTDPLGSDRGYVTSLAERGAWLEFDMIGMDLAFAESQAQSPTAQQQARAIARLIHDGFGQRILLSHDVFLKCMWTRHGGNGFGYIVERFFDQLVKNDVPYEMALALIDRNPVELFVEASSS